MAEDDIPSTGSRPDAEGDAGRRRPPPTIDLKAARVDTGETVDASAADAAPDPSAPSAKAPEKPRRQRSSALLVILAALVGAAAASAIGFAAWWSGNLSGGNTLRASTIASLETLAARVSRLEESRPQADPAVNGRLDQIDKALPALRDQVNGIRGDNEKLSRALEGVKGDVKTIQSAPPPAAPADAAAAAPAAPPVDLSPLEQRVSGTEQTLQALNAEIAKLRSAQDALRQRAEAAPKPAAPDRTLRRVVAVTALDTAVRTGEPIEAQLSALRTLGTDGAVLAPLDPFAKTGVPQLRALCDELLAQLRTMKPPAPPPAPAAQGTNPPGLMEKLEASAMKLVRIRRIDDEAALPPSTEKIAAAARAGDLAAAKREVLALAEAQRAPFKPWLDKVAARDAALAAARTLSGSTLSALATTEEKKAE